MRLTVLDGGTCDASECFVDTGATFTLAVEVLRAPASGYVLMQTFIDFGVYNPTASEDEAGAGSCSDGVGNGGNDGDDRFDVKANGALRKAVVAARQAMLPENYVQRVIQFARQGYTEIAFPVFDTDWESEAYRTVSGQNANNTVRVSNAFLERVRDDGEWELIRRTDGTVAERLRARDLWEEIAYAAWACADPGLQYDTTINEWHTCPASGRINASNPCSEYMFLDDTACNLASLNLMAFRNDDGTFDVGAFEHAVRLWTVTLEISVLMAQFPSRRIAELSYRFRTLGLGFANIGGYLMASGIAYDSDSGRAVCAAVSALMTGVAYATSAEMAAEMGAFPRFGENREAMLRVIRNHRRAAHGDRDGYDGLSVPPVPLDAEACPHADLAQAARRAWDRALFPSWVSARSSASPSPVLQILVRMWSLSSTRSATRPSSPICLSSNRPFRARTGLSKFSCIQMETHGSSCKASRDALISIVSKSRPRLCARFSSGV